MVISQVEGKIVSFEFNPLEGFLFIADTYPVTAETSVPTRFPFNVNCPKEVNLENYSFKRIKITVELIEE